MKLKIVDKFSPSFSRVGYKILRDLEIFYVYNFYDLPFYYSVDPKNDGEIFCTKKDPTPEKLFAFFNKKVNE